MEISPLKPYCGLTEELLERLHDEDDADQGGKGLLSEPGKVSYLKKKDIVNTEHPEGVKKLSS